MRFMGSIYTEKTPASFEMTLTREGSSIWGDYYYLRSGPANKLTLKGSVEPNGSFTMREFEGSGKQTGEFKGTWREEPYESGVTMDGEWTKSGSTEALSFAAEQQMIFFTGGARFTTAEMKDTIKAKRTDLSAEYPQLTGAANSTGFNAAVKARVQRSFADFRKLMAGFSVADMKSMPDEMRAYLDVGYSIEYASDDLVSLSFGEDTFAGGAHPNHDFFTLTYDLKKGREIKLAELFKPGSAYLKTIADHCRTDLRSRKDPESGENMELASDIFADGVKPTAANFKNWAITKKGLLILFPPYQVAAYAYGPQSSIVPYSKLRSIAAPGSPILKFAK
jgi:hypothetical protein